MNRYSDMTIWQLREELAAVKAELATRDVTPRAEREPNAAGWNEKGIAGIGVLPGEVDATAEPAPAAPDVAEMVKRLENGEIQIATMYEGEWVRDMDAAREIAALLARLSPGASDD